ncbi:MAG: hypothetical protein ACIAQF_10205, partial [Phycisphaerales bacterium JB065]
MLIAFALRHPFSNPEICEMTTDNGAATLDPINSASASPEAGESLVHPKLFQRVREQMERAAEAV